MSGETDSDDRGPSMLECALEVAAETGQPVFPLRPGAKRPKIDGWPQRATVDPDEIEKLWNEYDPGCEITREQDFNIGILTDRLLVIDVDVKDGRPGDQSLIELDVLYGDGEWLNTRTHRTASGGRHLLFSVDQPVKNSTSKIAPGLDVRGHHGYIVAPGSIVDGNVYSVEKDLPIRPAPEWLVKLAGKSTKSEKPDRSADYIDDNPVNVGRAIEFLKDHPPAVEDGTGDPHTVATARRLADYGVSQRTALDLMLKHWNNRCAPPWNPEQLATKIENGYKYRDHAIGCSNPASDFEPIEDDPAEEAIQGAHDAACEAEQKRLNAAIENFRRKGDPGYTNAVIARDADDLVADLMPRVGVGFLYGDPGSRKTQASNHLAVAIAAGKDWCGFGVDAKAGVVISSTEGVRGQRPRMLAALEAQDQPRTLPIATTWAGFDPCKPKDFVAYCRHLSAQFGTRIGLVILDNVFSHSVGKDVSSQADMTAFVDGMRNVATALHCFVLAVHHTPKGGESMFGSQALPADADLVIRLKKETDKSRAVVEKNRQGEEFMEFGFDVLVKDFGLNDRGRSITAPYVIYEKHGAEFEFDDDELAEMNPDQIENWSVEKNRLRLAGFCLHKLQKDKPAKVRSGFGPVDITNVAVANGHDVSRQTVGKILSRAFDGGQSAVAFEDFTLKNSGKGVYRVELSGAFKAWLDRSCPAQILKEAAE